MARRGRRLRSTLPSARESTGLPSTLKTTARAFLCMNLFFDGELVPSICAKVPLQAGDVATKLSANHARVTYTQTSYPTPVGPASGRLSAHLDQKVRLTEWSVRSPSLAGIDQVGSHQVAPSGRADYMATMTL